MKTVSGKMRWLGVLLVCFLGCSPHVPHEGVATGNPDLEDLQGKPIVVVPEAGDFAYLVTIVDATTAEVFQAVKEELQDFETVVETVSTTYTLEGGVLSLGSDFSNGSEVGVSLTLDEEANPLSTQITLNGSETPVSFQLATGIDQLATVACLRTIECGDPTIPNLRGCLEVADGEGLQEGGLTVAEIRQGLLEGSITTDAVLLEDCKAEIRQVDCSLILDHADSVPNPVKEALQPCLGSSIFIFSGGS